MASLTPSGSSHVHFDGVTVLTACFNTTRELLEECVHSVIDQHAITPYEHIIVDDGSDSSETLDALRTIERESAHVRVVHSPKNEGHAAALNHGLRNARYAYILPLDADDCLARANDGRNYLDEGYALLKSDPSIVIVYTRAKFFGERTGIWMLPSYDERRNLCRNMIPIFGMYRVHEALAVGGYIEKVRSRTESGLWVPLVNSRFKKGLPRHVYEFPDYFYSYRQHTRVPRLSDKRLAYIEQVKVVCQRCPEIYHHYFPEMQERGLDAVRDELHETSYDYFNRITRYGMDALSRENWKNMVKLCKFAIVNAMRK